MNIFVFATYCVLLLNMENCHADVSQEARQVHDGQYSIVDTQLDRNKRPRRVSSWLNYNTRYYSFLYPNFSENYAN